MCSKVDIPLEWNTYVNFYNGTRKKPGSNRKYCRNHNTLQIAIDYINNTMSSQSKHVTAGKKIFRKTKKHRSKRIYQKLKKSKNHKT